LIVEGLLQEALGKFCEMKAHEAPNFPPMFPTSQQAEARAPAASPPGTQEAAFNQNIVDFNKHFNDLRYLLAAPGKDFPSILPCSPPILIIINIGNLLGES
jgi:hypothetical protein